MQCKQIDDLMMRYFDNNISEIELEQLLRHTQKCAGCAAEFEILKDAIFEIETLPEIEPPEHLTASIMAAVSVQRHVHVSYRQMICWIMGFIGLVLFTYNIFAFVVVPAMGGEPLVSYQSAVQFVYWIAGTLRDGFVGFTLSLGKLLVIRNILFRDYTLYVVLWVVAFAAADILLYRLIKMKNKNDFEIGG